MHTNLFNPMLHRSRRGVALVLVVAVILLATVLGFAMLSGSMLQMRAGANLARSAQADAMAESGLNLAMYYLQHPDRAPSLNASGYWPGTGGDVTLDSSINGTVNVTVTLDSANQWRYEVSSTGKAGSSSATQLSRTTSARFYVRSQYMVTHTLGLNYSTSVYQYSTIDGDIYCNKTLTLRSGSVISGAVYSPFSPVIMGAPNNPGGGWIYTTSTAPAAPTSSDVNTYQTYTYLNATYTAQTVGSATLTSVTLGASAGNPAGIWYYNGDLTLSDNVVVNGSLIVQGTLTLNGKSCVITPASGFPGLVVTTTSSGTGGTLTIKQSKKSLLVNGVCFIATQLKSSGSFILASDNSSFSVYGGLLVGASSGTPIASGYNAATYVKLDSTKALAPDLSSVNRTPTGVSIVRWGPVVPAPY